MANARVALGAVLGTVTDVAGAVSTTTNTLTGSLDMLNAFVRDQQMRQRKSHFIGQKRFDKQLIRDLALQEAEDRKKISEICKDPESELYFNEAYAELEAIMATFGKEVA